MIPLSALQLPAIDTLAFLAGKADPAWPLRFEQLRAGKPGHERGYFLLLRSRFLTPEEYATHLVAVLQGVPRLQPYDPADLGRAIRVLNDVGEDALEWKRTTACAFIGTAADFVRTLQEFGLHHEPGPREAHEYMPFSTRLLRDNAENPDENPAINYSVFAQPLVHYMNKQGLMVRNFAARLAAENGGKREDWHVSITGMRAGHASPYKDSGSHTPLAQALAGQLYLDVNVLFPLEFAGPQGVLHYGSYWKALRQTMLSDLGPGGPTPPRDKPKDNPAPPKGGPAFKIPLAGHANYFYTPFTRCPIPSLARRFGEMPEPAIDGFTPGWLATQARAKGAPPADFHGPWNIVMGTIPPDVGRNGEPGPNLKALAAVTGLDAAELLEEWQAGAAAHAKKPRRALSARKGRDADADDSEIPGQDEVEAAGQDETEGQETDAPAPVVTLATMDKKPSSQRGRPKRPKMDGKGKLVLVPRLGAKPAP